MILQETQWNCSSRRVNDSKRRFSAAPDGRDRGLMRKLGVFTSSSPRCPWPRPKMPAYREARDGLLGSLAIIFSTTVMIEVGEGMEENLSTKWALVTGGAGGFGVQFATLLAERNANLVLISRRTAPMEIAG